MSEPFQLDGRVRSVGHALDGCLILVRTQHNAWVHAGATVLVLVGAISYRVTAPEWLFLIIAIASVWMAEGFNTALELLADAAAPEFHPLVGRAKDVAAGAVLIAASGSMAIGALVFAPRVLGLASAGF